MPTHFFVRRVLDIISNYQPSRFEGSEWMVHSAVATLFSNSAPFLLLTPSRSRVLECFELAIANATDPLSSVHPAFCIVHSVLCGCISFTRGRAEQWCHYISRWSGIYLSHVARHSQRRYCLIDALAASSASRGHLKDALCMGHASTGPGIVNTQKQCLFGFLLH